MNTDGHRSDRRPPALGAGLLHRGQGANSGQWAVVSEDTADCLFGASLLHLPRVSWPATDPRPRPGPRWARVSFALGAGLPTPPPARPKVSLLGASLMTPPPAGSLLGAGLMTPPPVGPQVSILAEPNRLQHELMPIKL